MTFGGRPRDVVRFRPYTAVESGSAQNFFLNTFLVEHQAHEIHESAVNTFSQPILSVRKTVSLFRSEVYFKFGGAEVCFQYASRRIC